MSGRVVEDDQVSLPRIEDLSMPDVELFAVTSEEDALKVEIFLELLAQPGDLLCKVLHLVRNRSVDPSRKSSRVDAKVEERCCHHIIFKEVVDFVEVSGPEAFKPITLKSHQILELGEGAFPFLNDFLGELKPLRHALELLLELVVQFVEVLVSIS